MARGLTAKQRRALGRAGKRGRARLAANFRGQRMRRDGGAGKGDASMLRGIKQGVGRSVGKPFGSMVTTTYHPNCHDAFHHCHLPLPRAVGPYSVVRTTEVIPGTFAQKALTIFGPFFNRANGKWSDLCGVGVNDLTKDLKTANNISVAKFTQLEASTWRAAQVTPAAFSIQVMNPNALQTTSGIVYIGRIRTALRLNEDLDVTGLELANSLVSYNNPRLCAAAKLAFRGVQVDLVPFNMADLATFTTVEDDSFTAYGANDSAPTGFAPMFIFNPSGIPLQFLVTAEWRVRFDPSNPAQATHSLHPPATESAWAKALHMAEAMGNGVVDIADRVANIGQAVYNASGSMYAAGRGLGALRSAAPLMLGM